MLMAGIFYWISTDNRTKLTYTKSSRKMHRLDDIAKEWNSLMDQGVLSIEDFDEVTVEKFDSSNVDTECVDLPDLSEFENMIDWGDNEDLVEPSAVL